MFFNNFYYFSFISTREFFAIRKKDFEDLC